MSQDLISIPQAARRLGVPKPTFYQWVNAGKIPVVVVGENRKSLTPETVNILRFVLKTEGRGPIHKGRILAA